MDVALRRLDGVSHVSLDTIGQEAMVYLGQPVMIEFDRVADAADSAAFLVKSIALHARGRVVLEHCDDCDREHAQLVLEGSGQSFHLAEETATWDAARDFSAAVLDWKESPVRLSLREGPQLP